MRRMLAAFAAIGWSSPGTSNPWSRRCGMAEKKRAPDDRGPAEEGFPDYAPEEIARHTR